MRTLREMASASKRPRKTNLTPEEVLEKIFKDDEDRLGISRDEKSEIDFVATFCHQNL